MKTQVLIVKYGRGPYKSERIHGRTVQGAEDDGRGVERHGVTAALLGGPGKGQERARVSLALESAASVPAPRNHFS